MNCDELAAILDHGRFCEETPDGARVLTHCLYPSFDQVAVYVSRWGSGFRVTDAGGAATAAFRHGKDEGALGAAFKAVCARYSLVGQQGMLIAEVSEPEWIHAAILAVANGSAAAAMSAAEHISNSQESTLKIEIYEELSNSFNASVIAKDFAYRGSSGKLWPIDVAIIGKEHPLLFKPVTPHHISISANYTTFGDIASSDNSDRFSVYDRKLKDEDATLVRQVARLTPIRSLRIGAERQAAIRLS